MKKILILIIMAIMSVFMVAPVMVSASWTTADILSETNTFEKIGIYYYYTFFDDTNTDTFNDSFVYDYVREYIIPNVADEAEYNTALSDFVALMRTTGYEIVWPGDQMWVYNLHYAEYGMDPWVDAGISDHTEMYIILTDLTIEGFDYDDMILPYPVNINEAWIGNVRYKITGASVDPDITININMLSDLGDPTGTAPIGIRTFNTNQTFTVKFNSNGGTAIADQTINNGSPAVRPADPTRANYTFYGWSTINTYPVVPRLMYPQVAYINNLPIYANTVYYAMWRAVTHNVTLDLNGGSLVLISGNTGYLTVVHGQTVDQNINGIDNAGVDFDNLTDRKGYIFDGWYTDDTFATEFDRNTAITADTTIHAKWVEDVSASDITPPFLIGIMNDWNLYNFTAFFIIYSVLMIGFAIFAVIKKWSALVVWIVNILFYGLFLTLGWFQLWAIIILAVIYAVVFLFIIKSGGSQ